MRSLLLSLLSCSVLFCSAQNFAPIDSGSKVQFSIKNFGVSTGGTLTGLRGAIYFDPNNIKACQFDVSIDASSVDTDSESRDDYIRGEDYFNVERYPHIIIKSTKISYTSKSNRGVYQFEGTLSIAGTTRRITFPFTVTRKAGHYLFAGDFTIDRLDYDIGENSSILSNTVKVSISVLAKKT
jgi:polyisoprenoid-binding protein YceI